MNMVKALLVSSAAALTGFAAQAADLPKKSAPAEYVKVCNGQGAGFFIIPGSNTCVKIGGSVEYFQYYGSTNTAANSVAGVTNGPRDYAYSTRARAQLNFDARTQTSMGVLRSVVELRLIRDGATGNAVTAATSTAVNGAAPHSNVTTMNAAYIQFAGITAGYAANPFNFAGFQSNAIALYHAPTASNVAQFAYTASLGSGLTATAAIVDANYMRVGNSNPAGLATDGIIYGGNANPDLVGNINLTQAWGSLQVAAAYHDVRTAVTSNSGYAVSAGALFNLPMISAGDTFYVNAAYAKGAMAYLKDDGNRDNLYTNQSGPVSQLNPDAIVGASGVALSTGWSVFSGFKHLFSPTVAASVYGGYTNIDLGLEATKNDFKYWSLGTNLTWAPVAGFNVSGEITYRNVKFNSQAVGATSYNTNTLFSGIRLQRTF